MNLNNDCNSCESIISSLEHPKDSMTARRHRYFLCDRTEQEFKRVQTMGWPRQYFACPFIFRQGTLGYYCLICGCAIYGNAAFGNHVHGKRHAASIERYGCDITAMKDDFYHCSRCDCVVPYYTNVFSHITGKRHQSLSRSESGMIDWSSCEYFVCPFVSREGFEKYYCLICGCYMFGHTAFQRHIHGKLHAIAVEMFGSCISPMGDDYYYCSQCDCTVPHYKNVYDHIVGQRHQNLFNEINEQRDRNAGEEETKEWSAESAVIVESSKLATFSKNSYELIARQQNLLYDLNEQDNREAEKEEAEAPKLSTLAEDDYNDIIGQQHRYDPSEPKNREVGKEEVEEQIGENETISKLMVAQKLAVLAGDDPLPKVLWASTQSYLDHNFVKENASTHSSGHNISDEQLLQSYESPSQSTLYEPIVRKNTTDNEHNGFVSKAEKPNKFNEVLPHNYTILSRHVDNGSKDSRRDFCWKKIADKVEPPIRLNLSSWQVSSCKHSLQNSNVKNESQNSTCKNITDNVGIPVQRDTSSNANTQLSLNNSVLLKLAKQLRLVKKAEDNVSTEPISPEDSVTNGVELRANSTSRLSEKSARLKVDVNGNKRSNNTRKNDRSVDIAELISTSNINDFTNADPMIHGVDLNMNELSSNSASSSSNSESVDEDSSPQQSPSSLKQKIHPERSSKKIVTQKLVHISDPDEDIYDTNDKKRAIKLGTQSHCAIDSENIYCLICQKVVAAIDKNYVEHFCCTDHCKYPEAKKKDHARTDLLPEEFSEFYLADQYMVGMSQDTVHCTVCDKVICNVNYALRKHIDEDMHRRRREEMHAEAKQYFEFMESQMQCDWYKIHKYWCAPCSANFVAEINFVEHLKGTEHANITKISENSEREPMYDFCTLCSVLWYGYQCTYGNHCDSSRHKWLMLHERYESVELSESAKRLLATPEGYVEEVIKYLDDVSVEEEKNNKTLIDYIENAVKLMFPRAKAYAFGSRLNGLSSPDGDINVFLGDMYDGEISSHQISYFIKIVHKCLSDDPSSRNTEELESCCRSNTIRVHHRGTGLSCRISFENGLAVENSKLIESLINIFPMCQKLLLFLKQWLAFCHLSELECITSYALYWLIVFYLQKESMLPSLAKLIAIEEKSHIIADWEVGTCNDYVHTEAGSTIGIKEHLIRFFTFYAKFDFRYDVACPLLGEIVKKQTFTDPQNLPRGMEPHIAYMESSDFPEPFRIDTAVCVQDPFNLRENLTKAVSKAHLSRFRICCSESLLLLCPSSKTH